MKAMLAPVILALTALFIEQAWWVRGLMGAALGGALFIGIPIALDWAKQQTNKVKLRVDCVVDFLPTMLPAEGRVAVIQLSPPPDVPHQVGTSMQKYGNPGTLTMWPPGSHANKCEIRNLGPTDVYDVALTLSFRLNQAVHPDGRIYSGELVRSGDVSILVPRIEGKTPFTFYVANLSPYYASMTGVKASPSWKSSEKAPRMDVNFNPDAGTTLSPAGI